MESIQLAKTDKYTDACSQSIDVDLSRSMMRARSHKYPDNNDYTDTTYYDDENGSFDLGYQRLKYLDVKMYSQFSYLKKLFIDHNRLAYLPEAKYLPNLEQLNCSYNDLTDIPFYPKLTFLNIAGNRIIDCSQYHNSTIQYFDCSYNSGFIINFYLSECRHLYINDSELKTINLDLFPKLHYFDCGNNKLTKIVGGSNLVELNIQSNNIQELAIFPNLKCLMADHNTIKILFSYPNLTSLNISYNQLVEIKEQPLLKQLTANNNQIQILGKMPELETCDLRHNCLTNFTVTPKMEHLFLQFNPTKDLLLDNLTLKNIKELQVNFETYKFIYKHYYHHFEGIHIQINEGKLNELLQKLDKIFNEQMARYIYKKFTDIKFGTRDDSLFKISLKLYWDYFSNTNVTTLDELVNTQEFKHLLKNISKFYYKTLVVTFYFNGYDLIYDERLKHNAKIPLEN